MIGAGTIISPIIKIVTTVAILGAIYLFFVKPTLDTTENISSSISESVGESIDGFDNFAPDIQKDVDRALKQAEKATGSQTASVNKLLDCINDASGNVEKISACNSKFSP
jgi:hypothetical protein